MLIDYDFPLWRPPSEANSLIIQATLGCSFNHCSFCIMYRSKQFTVRPLAEVEAQVLRVARSAVPVRRIFLGDGDALAALFGRHLMELSLHRRVMAHPRYCFSFWVRQLMCSRCRI